MDCQSLSPITCPPFRRRVAICYQFPGLFGDPGCTHWIIPPTCNFSDMDGSTVFIMQLNASAGCCPDGFHLIYLGSFNDAILDVLIDRLLDPATVQLKL